jgi:hypothetical protein
MENLFHSKFVTGLTVLLLVALAALHFYVVASYAVDLPFADDFHLLKNVVWAEQRHLSFGEMLREMAVQHNEHRIIFPRLYTWLDDRLEGRINWLTLTTFGVCFVLGFVALFFQTFRKLRLPLVYFLPVGLLLFQPQSYDSLTWTISILQQYCVFFWLFLLALLIPRPAPAAFVGAMVVAVVAVFTHGNGILGFAWGAAVLLLQRRWVPLAAWLAALSVVAFFYFGFGYAKGQNGDAAGSLAQPLRFVGGIFAFLGAFADAFRPGKFTLPILVGAVVALGLVVVNGRALWAFLQPASRNGSLRRYLTTDRFFLMGCAAVLLATALITSLFRSWSGLQGLVQVRYIHMAALAFIVFYLTMLYVLPPRWRSLFFGAVLSFTGAFWLLTQFWTHLPLTYRRDCQWADAFNWKYHETFVQYPQPFNVEIRPTYADGIRRGICPLPRTPLTAAEPALLTPAERVDSSLRVRVSRSEMLIPEPNALRRFAQFDFSGDAGEGDSFVVLKSGVATYLVGTWRSRNTWQTLLRTGRYFGSGFSGSVLSGVLQPGTYRVGILTRHDGRFSLRFSAQTVTVS